jgi:hypothetical protein
MALHPDQEYVLRPFNPEYFAWLLYLKSLSAENLCFDDVKVDLIEALVAVYEAGKQAGAEVR